MEIETINETINDRIRFIIEKEGYTVSSFAKKIEIGDQTIRSITKNRNKPGYDLIVKIIENFDWIDANWLIMGKKGNGDSEKKLYEIIANQQKTIDRLTERIVQESSSNSPQKVESAG